MKKLGVFIGILVLGLTMTVTAYAADGKCTADDCDGTTVETEEVAATCTEVGCKAYWTCDTCGKSYADEQGSELIEDLESWKSEDGKIEALGHTLAETIAVEPDCETAGCKAYWTCDTCGKNYADEQGSELIEDLESWKSGDGKVAALGHELVDGVCTRCGGKEDIIWTDGIGYYVIGDSVQSGFTGLKADAAGTETYRIKKGKVDSSAQGFYSDGEDKWYVENGKVQSDYTGLAQNSKGEWYYVKNGKYTIATGIARKADGSDTTWYYVQNGKYTEKTGIARKIEDSSSVWYYVQNGIYTEGKGTGLAKKADGSDSNWYYVKDGLYTKATGLARKASGSDTNWYYVENGKYTKATGIAKKVGSSSGWFFVKNGKYKKATGIAQKADKSSTAWYFVKNGKYSKATGIAKKADGSSSDWYYVKAGRYNKATGLARKADGSSTDWFYVKNGKYKKATGMAQKVSGSSSDWYYVENGKYTVVTGLYRCSGNWRYVKKGKIDFSFTGVASNSNGWWYLKNGLIDFSYNGTVRTTIHGLTQNWSVVNGKVSFDSTIEKMVSKAQNYSSGTGYLIMVDCWENRVGIFTGSTGNWQLYKYWQCCTGAGDTKTPKGVFSLTANRGYSFSGPDGESLTYSNPNHYTCYYYSGFLEGGYLFHSTLYRYGTYEVLDDSLGLSISHGCIRLALENAKWMYYNLPVGTTVVTYS